MKLMRKVFEVDEEEMVSLRKYSEGIGADLAIKTKLDDPACWTGVEDYFPGTVTSRLGYRHSEIHIVLKGKAEVEYATTHGYGDWIKKKFTAEPGDAYFIDLGDQVVFRVLSDEPYRHFCIIIPAAPFAAPPKRENEP